MIDLKNQYLNIKQEVDDALQQCLLAADYIKGEKVELFEKHLSDYTGIKHTIGCGNGTDALQLALMALDLPKNSKIIIPAFTYIAPIEVVAFLGHELVFADVDLSSFNITLQAIQSVYTEDVKAIIIVHLFGQPCNDMDAIYQFCTEKGIALIEDNAQSLGAEKKAARNTLLTTSFYPTKNLGGFGDGGAVLTNDDALADKIRKTASHGQSKKYIHDVVGINSRLDTIQAAILDIKLKHVDTYNLLRKKHAAYYHHKLGALAAISLPEITPEHIFHQFTIQVKNGKRNELAEFLKQQGIASIINYPLPAYKQKAYVQDIHLPNTELLCNSALSIPVYPEISETQLSYICDCILDFFDKK